jgi:hypothetical protein
VSMNKRKLKPKTKTRNKNELLRPKVYLSKPMHLDITKLENPFKRADIEFYGLDHSGASYEGRVFLNNPKANQDTPKTLENKYVGSFYIFGHGGCYGDVGHCEVIMDRRPYDYRASHPLTPAYKRIIVTEKLRELAKSTNKFTVTVVPVLARDTTRRGAEDVVKLERLSIITYD